ncbi:hypothetical protein G6F58_011254 [Rhizopus delemar]|nr:hypothetical protein G6F58_011254 [Rhizopus delemar]
MVHLPGLKWKHFRMNVDGLLMHYIHERSSEPNAIPIVLLHGWPSTFYEFHKIIDPLRDGAGNNQAFHVIVPSLPGFGFSQAPKIKGYGIVKIASMINALMINLGYNEYMYHGGDWGAIIGKTIAVNHSDSCKAFHTTMPMVLPPIPTPRNILFHPFKVAKFLVSLVVGFDWIYGKGNTRLGGATFANAERDKGCGYRAIQGTRPYTLSFGLTDSPAGVLAWLLEKYHEWTFHPAERQNTESLPETISSKEFLTQVSIYWMTNTISSSVRIYYECLNQNELTSNVMSYVKIPFAVSSFASEIAKLPKDWLEASANLQQYSEVKYGGHFPGLEEPQILLADLQKFGKHIKKTQIL